MPFFSIIIPTYNRCSFISSTINSVLCQDFSDYEIIIIDDGSTDDTRNVILNQWPDHPYIKYVYQDNSERGAARNVGIKKANGYYIVFLDSDDLMHNNHLHVLYQLITKNPSINFFATKYDIIRNNKTSTSSVTRLKTGIYSIDLFLEGNPLAVNFCIKKNNPSLFLFVEDRKYSTMEDWIFLIQNLKMDVILISEPITISLNDHQGRSMRQNNQLIIEKKLNAMEWILQNIELKASQKKKLKSYSYYFCSIHSYIENERKKAFKYLLSSICLNGIRYVHIVLGIKILLGYNSVQKFKLSE